MHHLCQFGWHTPPRTLQGTPEDWLGLNAVVAPMLRLSRRALEDLPLDTATATLRHEQVEENAHQPSPSVLWVTVRRLEAQGAQHALLHQISGLILVASEADRAALQVRQVLNDGRLHQVDGRGYGGWMLRGASGSLSALSRIHASGNSSSVPARLARDFVGKHPNFGVRGPSVLPIWHARGSAAHETCNSVIGVLGRRYAAQMQRTRGTASASGPSVSPTNRQNRYSRRKRELMELLMYSPVLVVFPLLLAWDTTSLM